MNFDEYLDASAALQLAHNNAINPQLPLEQLFKQFIQEQQQQQQQQQQQLQQQQQQQQQKEQRQEQKQHQSQDQEQDHHTVISKELQDSQARITSRLSHARGFCQRKYKTATPKRYACPLLSKRPLPSKFCAIAKIGSTFFARFYKVLRDATSDELDSPYKVSLKVVDGFRCYKNANISAETGKSVTAIFVREPFSRVFSAYVDKLISPNPIFWEKWGKPAMKLDGLTTEQARCGQGVTFRQFLRFVNERIHKNDPHVIPMTKACDPCDDYDVIGNMETFPGDMKYLMALLNVSFKRDVELSREAKLDAIFDSIQGPFEWMKNVKPCISTPEMGRRIWRKLQIRGLISSRIEYPLGNKDLTNMTTEEFNSVAVQAHHKSTDKHVPSQQKRQAFIEAYRTVSFNEIRKYVRIFEDDFEAFGFEKNPSSVLAREDKFNDTKALDFNRPWII